MPNLQRFRPGDFRPWGEDRRVIRPFTPEDPDFYATLQMTLPGLERIEESLCQKALDLLEIVRGKDAKSFANKMSALQDSMKKRQTGHSR